MNDQTVINCGVPDCSRLAKTAAIVDMQRFCLVPAMNNVPDPLPLVRFNLCDSHLTDVRTNFTEVIHDARFSDYRDIDI